MELNQEYVKLLFDYKDGFLYWKVQKGTMIKIGQRAAHLQKMKSGNRYTVRIDYKSYYCSRIIFLWHKGYLPEFVDHTDRDKLNDKINNLRASTKSQNCQNKSSHKNSASKYLGVHQNNSHTKWKACIYVNGKNMHLGTFETDVLAALAYNEAAKKYHGEFASLNVT